MPHLNFYSTLLYIVSYNNLIKLLCCVPEFHHTQTFIRGPYLFENAIYHVAKTSSSKHKMETLKCCWPNIKSIYTNCITKFLIPEMLSVALAETSSSKYFGLLWPLWTSTSSHCRKHNLLNRYLESSHIFYKDQIQSLQYVLKLQIIQTTIRWYCYCAEIILKNISR